MFKTSYFEVDEKLYSEIGLVKKSFLLFKMFDIVLKVS